MQSYWVFLRTLYISSYVKYLVLYIFRLPVLDMNEKRKKRRKRSSDNDFFSDFNDFEEWENE